MLTIQAISKTYEGRLLLKQVSFTVLPGETVSLLGPSGSGKSTLLRIIAGLEAPETGAILWNGVDLAPIPPHARDFGLVFQDYALFPHLNVFENVAFGLRMRPGRLAAASPRAFEAALRARVAEVLDLVNLRGFEHRKVTDLSGGEQQRVALARALAPSPRLLMFDEPLGALDRSLKEALLHELRAILRRTGIPAIYVTHDQEEAFAIADRVLILHRGEIVRAGRPAEVWYDPRSPWVARFLGAGNVLEGTITPQGQVETSFSTFSPPCQHNHPVGERVALLFRQDGRRKSPLRLKLTVDDVLFRREGYEIRLHNGWVVRRKRPPQVGETLSLVFYVECLGRVGTDRGG